MPRHRGWPWWKAVAYYTVFGALIVVVAVLIGGCATSEEMRLRMRVRELEQALAGAQDDAGMLLKFAAEQDQYIRELESGAMWQAREMARIRSNCEM